MKIFLRSLALFAVLLLTTAQTGPVFNQPARNTGSFVATQILSSGGGSLTIGTPGAGNLIFRGNGTDRWQVTSAGTLTPVNDISYSLGGSSTRILDVHTSRGLLNGTTKTLTESSATGLADVTLASNSRVSGILYYTIEANDASDFQALTGSIPFTAVNKAGTITAAVGTPTTATEIVAVSAGTLTVTITAATGASKITLSANAVSSLTQTTLQAKWKIVSPDALSITAL